MNYYWLLRPILRTTAHAHRYLCRCRHCRIFFITDPRNAGRRDLGCPFGCSQAHRKTQSTRRSVQYYRGKVGKLKKSIQNNKRRRAGREAPAQKEPLEQENPPPHNEPLVEHVRFLSSLIEGRRVSRAEVLEMLGEVLRQHSMVRFSKVDHIVWQLNKNPP